MVSKQVYAKDIYYAKKSSYIDTELSLCEPLH